MPEEQGIRINRVRKTARGDLAISIKKDGQKAQNLQSELSKKIEGVQTTILTRKKPYTLGVWMGPPQLRKSKGHLKKYSNLKTKWTSGVSGQQQEALKTPP